MTRPHSPERRAKDAAYWGAPHLRGDRNPPIDLPDRRVRRSIGTATRIMERGRKEQVVYE